MLTSCWKWQIFFNTVEYFKYKTNKTDVERQQTLGHLDP